MWWPSTDEVIFPDLPLWNDAAEDYVDPDTGGVLPTWDEALDALASDEDAEPTHVVEFGTQLRAEGVLGGSPVADRGKAHRHETLGFGGRRVLVSRKWSGKTLAVHTPSGVSGCEASSDSPTTRTPSASSGSRPPPATRM